MLATTLGAATSESGWIRQARAAHRSHRRARRPDPDPSNLFTVMIRHTRKRYIITFKLWTPTIPNQWVSTICIKIGRLVADYY